MSDTDPAGAALLQAGSSTAREPFALSDAAQEPRQEHAEDFCLGLRFPWSWRDVLQRRGAKGLVNNILVCSSKVEWITKPWVIQLKK